MIKIYLIFCLFSLNLACLSRELKDFERFLKILGQLESNNNDFAIGDNGKAIGRYQIWCVFYQDAREFNKNIQFSYESLTNKTNSEIVIKAYLSRYSETNEFEEWAKLFNGGPAWRKATGQKKKNLDNYWIKFQNINARKSK